MKTVDLHTHSTRSDGTFTPTQLVRIAQKKRLSAFALTDHDTAIGIEEAMKAAAGTDVEVIPGIELSTKYLEKDVHIIGLFYDYKDPEFCRQVKEFSDARDLRNRKMCDMMCEAGLPIPYDELMADNPGAIVTRANMAKFLLKKGAISSLKEAFDKYIGDDCPFFVPREKITPKKAVEFLLRFHGIPVLAHPFQYKLGDEGLETLVAGLKEAGLMGIEAYYCKHTPEMTEKIRALARRYDLLLSGGSDFHGTNKPGLEMGTGYGRLAVPEACLTKMKHARFHVTDQTKIFFCDFDGTLATDKKTISSATRRALDDFTGRGNLFVLSSGRAMPDAQLLSDKLQLHYPNQFISAYNGAELYSCDEKATFFRETLPIPVVRDVMNLAKEHGLHCQTYDADAIITWKPNRETDFYVSPDRMPIPLPVRYADDPAGALSKPPCKCLSIHLENETDHALEPFARELEEKYGDILHTVMSNPWYLEIDPLRATKGYSLRWLCRHLGISTENAIAAGDAPNDNSMLEAAGLGIGMCNGLFSNPGMKQAADVITKTDNNHDGLVPILRSV